MERKNEIIEESVKIYPRFAERRVGFIGGALWADENPKPGMVNKQEFIAKVRRWLELETDWNMEYDEEGRNDNYGKIDELVKYLEK